MTRVQMLFQILQEELAEAITAASKCQRFTPEEVWNDRAGNPKGLSNRDRLRQELIDIRVIMILLEREGVYLDTTPANSNIGDKIAKVEKYLEYSRKVGTLQ